MNTQQVKRAGTLYAIGGAIWFLFITFVNHQQELPNYLSIPHLRLF